MKKYTVDEWIDLLVGAVDFEEALAEVRNLEPTRPELHKKLSAIADPEQENVNARVWDALQRHITHAVYALVPIETEFIDVIMALETIRAEHPKVENEQACKRLAGLLAQRIQAAEAEKPVMP